MRRDWLAILTSINSNHKRTYFMDRSSPNKNEKFAWFLSAQVMQLVACLFCLPSCFRAGMNRRILLKHQCCHYSFFLFLWIECHLNICVDFTLFFSHWNGKLTLVNSWRIPVWIDPCFERRRPKGLAPDFWPDVHLGR